ncbi:MAG: Ala-tRNA(Pro) hydrolase [Clostridia bacterium BRH_c25]|nr:MAG: Ala-tRNA(Pro) hydrolase [Clostridia bacterium BRH_c25]
MTELLFQTDSYLKEFSAEVLETDSAENAVILDRTAFYPGGGGQLNDTGFLHAGNKSYKVSKVKKQDGRILHCIEGELPAAGTEVKGQLDWESRYKLMRTHTAMHILCGVVWRDYNAQVTGGNMEPLAGRMDFEFENLEAALIKEIEEKVNQEVKAARDVRVKILPREEAFQIPDLIRTKINLLPEGISHVRTVEIAGLDLQADGGTHVANTREVGVMEIVEYKSKGKINKRIYVKLCECAS